MSVIKSCVIKKFPETSNDVSAFIILILQSEILQSAVYKVTPPPHSIKKYFYIDNSNY